MKNYIYSTKLQENYSTSYQSSELQQNANHSSELYLGMCSIYWDSVEIQQKRYFNELSVWDDQDCYFMTAESESAKDSTLVCLEGSAEGDIALASEDTSRCFKTSTSEHGPSVSCCL